MGHTPPTERRGFGPHDSRDARYRGPAAADSLLRGSRCRSQARCLRYGRQYRARVRPDDRLYDFQLTACNVVGYAFTTDSGRRQWNKGFIASQALLGIVLTPVAAAALFFPEDSTMVFVVAAAAYIAARVTFIAKGFRLFYDNFLSLLYFILYFCTLEIAPVAALYLISINIIA